MNKNYRLDIYTWPAVQGIDAQVRTSFYDTPQEAVMWLDLQHEPYAYAALQAKNNTGYAPCGWNGEPLSGGVWNVRYGTNGDHPAIIALRADWGNMVNMIVAEYWKSYQAMIEIASRILGGRHPEVTGYAEPLALQAADVAMEIAKK